MARPLGRDDDALSERCELASRDDAVSPALRRSVSSRDVCSLSSPDRPTSVGFGLLGGRVASSPSAARFLLSGVGGFGGSPGGLGGNLWLMSTTMFSEGPLVLPVALLSVVFFFPSTLVEDSGGALWSGAALELSEPGAAECRSACLRDACVGVESAGGSDGETPVVFLFL
jgi:hypothetical protein